MQSESLLHHSRAKLLGYRTAFVCSIMADVRRGKWLKMAVLGRFFQGFHFLAAFPSRPLKKRPVFQPSQPGSHRIASHLISSPRNTEYYLYASS